MPIVDYAQIVQEMLPGLTDAMVAVVDEIGNRLPYDSSLLRIVGAAEEQSEASGRGFTVQLSHQAVVGRRPSEA